MNAEPVVMRLRVRRSASRTIGLVAATALVTSACAAGQLAQTSNQKATIDGINKSVGSIDLRAVAIAAPPLGTNAYRPRTAAELKLVLVNSGSRQDTLTSITTSAAGGWATYADYSDAFRVQEAGIAAIEGSPSPSAAPSSASSSAAASSPTAPAPSSTPPKGSQVVLVPAGGRASFGTPEAAGAILLMPVTRTLYPGNSVKITFTFANAGSVTFTVPIQLAIGPRTAKVDPPGGTSSEEP